MWGRAKKKKRTHTRNENPMTWRKDTGTTKCSQPRPRLMIQIASVLQVSTRLLAVALTWRVTLSPKKLNSDMLIAMATPEYKTVGVVII